MARLSAIAECVRGLRTLQKVSFEEFAREHVLHAAAERDFQVAIQAAIDIGSIILTERSVRVPDSYREVFLELARTDVIPSELARALAAMAQFRNVLVHLYLQVDLRRVYAYLQNNLGDLEELARHVGDYLQE